MDISRGKSPHKPLSPGSSALQSTPRSSLGAHAPEVDQSALAPQPYILAEGLQIATVDGPEFAFGTEELETSTSVAAVPSFTKGAENENPHNRWSRRRKWVLFAASFCVLVVIALGTGLGIRFAGQHAASSTASPPSLGNGTEPNPPTIPLINGVSNDSSLASVITADNDRHLFFQDINGTLRHAVFSTSQNSWLSSVDFVVTPTKARNKTPIAALDVSTSVDILAIDVYFVDENNTLDVVRYYSGYAPVVHGSLGLLNGSFIASPETKSLSIIRPGAPNPSTNSRSEIDLYDGVLLFYENPSHNITVLQNTVFNSSNASTSSSTGDWAWNNVSDIFNPQNYKNSPGGWIGSPFSAVLFGDIFSACFFAPQSIDGESTPYFTFFAENISTPIVNSSSLRSLHPDLEGPSNKALTSLLSADKSDMLCLFTTPAFVSNGVLNSTLGSPKTPFPFGRLAFSNISTTAYVYHQINESMLAEEALDINLGASGWVEPNFISIPTK